MASADGPDETDGADETVDADAVPRRAPLPLDQVDLPVYRPRRRPAWLRPLWLVAVAVLAAVAAAVVVLVLF